MRPPWGGSVPVDRKLHMQFEKAEHNGFSGLWMSSDGTRAFVTATPFPRIIAFETPDHASVLHVSTAHEYYGVRSWFLEPEQTEQSGLPALMPAVFEETKDTGLTLRTAKEPQSGLSLRMTILIDPEARSLIVTHEFRNETARDRYMAPWGIVAVSPGDLIGFTKWRSGRRHTLTVTAPARVSDPLVNHGYHTISVDFSRNPHAEFLKLGTDTDCGWVACANDRTAVWLHTAFDETGTYPEGGGTVTFFRSGEMTGGAFAEIESVGPLRHVGAGATMNLRQTLTMTSGFAGRTTDDYVVALESGEV